MVQHRYISRPTDSPAADAIALCMGEASKSPSFSTDIVGNHVVKLEHLFLARDLGHPAEDVCLEVVAEPLREGVCEPHRPRSEKGGRGGPVRPPLITLNLLTRARNRLEKAVAHKNRDTADSNNIHDSGEFVQSDDSSC